MNKQPGSTHSTTLNGSRSCYITVKRFSFLSVGTKVARTVHISKNILNWFWSVFKNVNPLTKRQEKGICLIFKIFIAHLTHRRALRALVIASSERLKSLFSHAKFTRPLRIWTIHVFNENNSAIVIRTIGGECATHCNSSQLFHNYLQGKICFCRDGEFRDHCGWQFL